MIADGVGSASRSPQVRERERQTRERRERRGGQTEVLMLTQPPILPLRDEVMAAADQRQKHDPSVCCDNNAPTMP
jgi:hypothetical protein